MKNGNDEVLEGFGRKLGEEISKPKNRKNDWFLRLMTTTAVGMLMKVNAKVADIDKRLFGVEKTIELMLPTAPRHSLLERPKATIHSAFGFPIEILMKRKEEKP